MAKKKSVYFLHKGQLYEEQDFDNGLYTAGVKVNVPQRDDMFSWKGPMIPMNLHRQIISFFQAGYKETNSENLIWLYCDLDAGEWLAWAPPQECVGMTVKALETDPEFKKQRKLIDMRFVQLGTYHHHCSGGAGCSGTDKDDEEDRDGIHITLGGLGQFKKELSIHARATFKGVNYITDASEWIDWPTWIENVPKEMRNKLYWDLVLMPHAELEFPEQWLKNCKKKSYQYTPAKTTQNATQRNFPEWDRKNSTTGKQSTESQVTDGDKELKELLNKYLLTIPWKDRPNTFDRDDIFLVIKHLFQCGLDCSDVEDWIFTLEEGKEIDAGDMANLTIFMEAVREEGLHPKRVLSLISEHDVGSAYNACLVDWEKDIEDDRIPAVQPVHAVN